LPLDIGNNFNISKLITQLNNRKILIILKSKVRRE